MMLHWSPRSPFVRKVMIAAHEVGVADRVRTVRTPVKMMALNAALMKDNPLGRIPTLVLDDGRTMFDSVVICEYLDATFGTGRLFPPAGEARWDCLTRHALANQFLETLILYRNERNKPEARQTPDLLDVFAGKTQGCLDRMEAAVGGDPQRFDMGEITFGCALSYLDFRFEDIDWRIGRPRLAAWHETFRSRPSVTATEIVDDS